MGNSAAPLKSFLAPVDAGVGAVQNKIINGQFTHWQRGTTFSGGAPVGGGAYTADRWIFGRNGSSGIGNWTRQTDRIAFAAGQTDVPDNPTYYMDFSAAYVGGDGTESIAMVQRIEDVRTFNGKTATLSFWAKGSIAGNIVVNFGQNVGSGGTGVGNSPQDRVVPLTSNWRKYVIVWNVGSLAGATIAGGDDSFRIRWGLQEGASGGIFVETPAFQYAGTVSLANVQFEAGQVNDPDFEIRDPGYELQLCQRYYEEGHKVESTFAQIAFTNEMWMNYKVMKRAPATVVIAVLESPPTGSGVTPGTLQLHRINEIDGFGIKFSANNPSDTAITTATSGSGTFAPWTADAEL